MGAVTLADMGFKKSQIDEALCECHSLNHAIHYLCTPKEEAAPASANVQAGTPSRPRQRQSLCPANTPHESKSSRKPARWAAGTLTPSQSRKSISSCGSSPATEWWSVASERWQQNVSTLRKKLGRPS